jgi:hypothetical protein
MTAFYALPGYCRVIAAVIDGAIATFGIKTPGNPPMASRLHQPRSRC